MVVQKPFCRGFSTFRCLFKFTSGQVSLTFVVASSIFFTSPLKVVPISVTSAPNESSGIFWDHESWLKKKRMNTRVIWEHRYISVFRWKIKKSLETSETYFQQIWIFPHYCRLHCTSVDIWNSDDILTFVIFPEFLCEFTLKLLVFVVKSGCFLTMLVWHSSLQGHRLVFDFIEFYNSIRRHFELHRRRFAVTQGQKLWQII